MTPTDSVRSSIAGPGNGAFAGGAAAAPYLSPAGALMALGAAIVLCWPMLLVTAPLVFFDTASYFTNGEEIFRRVMALLGGRGAGDGGLAIGLHAPAAAAAEVPAAIAAGRAPNVGEDETVTFRSIPYAAFLYPVALLPLGLVLVCIVQTAMVLWAFLALVPPLTDRATKAAGAGFAAVAALSSLPWFASYAMPDILGAVLPIYFALALGRADGFGLPSRLVLMAIAAFAILSHYGHLPLSFGLALVVVVWRAVWRRLTVAALAFCLLPLAAALAFNLAVSIAVGALIGQPQMVSAAPAAETDAQADAGLATPAADPAPAEAPPSSVSFAPNRIPVLLARSLEDGPGRWYLQEECREVDRYAICELFDEIPDRMPDLLWAADGLHKATPEQLARIRAEEIEIVLGGALRYPLHQAEALARNTAQQMVFVGTGELLPLPEDASTADMAGLIPRLADSEDNRTLELFDWIVPIFTGLAFLVLGWRMATGRTRGHLLEAALILLLALLANAVIYGGLSAPADRYQARLAWLVPALLALELALRARAWRASSAAVQRT